MYTQHLKIRMDKRSEQGQINRVYSQYHSLLKGLTLLTAFSLIKPATVSSLPFFHLQDCDDFCGRRNISFSALTNHKCTVTGPIGQ